MVVSPKPRHETRNRKTCPARPSARLSGCLQRSGECDGWWVFMLALHDASVERWIKRSCDMSEPSIDWSDFEKVLICAGTVQRVEEFPEARKPAWKIWVDFGPYGIK